MLLKRLYPKAILPILGAIAFFYSSCNNSGDEIREIVSLASTVSAEYAEDVEFSYTDSGRLKVVLFAPKSARFHYKDNPYTEMVEGVDVKFYDNNLNVETTLKSNYAKRLDKKNKVEVRNKVVVTNVKKEKLETEKLLWDQNTRQIYTDKFVTITTKNQIITGSGLRANENFTKWTILKPQGTFTLENDGK